MRTGRLIALALAFAAPAHAEAPEATARVHDHAAFVFRAPLGGRSPAQRAAEATASLGSVIDDEAPGEVVLVLRGDQAAVLVGSRPVFQLGEADARGEGASSLAEYATRAQGELQGFLTKERRRAHLQKGVLGVSLAVFFAVLVWVLLRAFFRATRAFEERLERGEELLPERMRKLGLLEERSRGAVLFGLSALRIAVALGAVYVFLLASLSLFEATRPFRDRLALWAASPFRALGERLVLGLPNLLLLVVVLAVVRGGWRALTVGLQRMAGGGEAPGAFAAHQMIPVRLLARVGLVVGGLMVLPLLLGSEVGLFNAVGLVLLAVAGLASLPLLANVAVGVYALFTAQYPAGRWLRVRLPGGKQVLGEVTSVDFFHLRLVPEGGGDVRLPHLLALWSAVDHLSDGRALTVDLPVPRASLHPRDALAALTEAATRVATAQGLGGAPSVELRELTELTAHFRIALPEGTEATRTQLLLALEESTRERARA